MGQDPNGGKRAAHSTHSGTCAELCQLRHHRRPLPVFCDLRALEPLATATRRRHKALCDRQSAQESALGESTFGAAVVNPGKSALSQVRLFGMTLA